MDDIIKMQVKKGQRRHKRYLNLLAWGKSMKSFAKSGFFGAFGDSRVLGIASFAAHGILLLIMYGIAGEFLYAAIAYAVFRILLLILGTQLIKIFTKKLETLGEEFRELRQRYFKAQCRAHGIEDEAILFEDGVRVTRTGGISVPMEHGNGSYWILQLSDPQELAQYNQARLELPENRCVVAHSASVEFTKKFGIIGEDVSEIEAAKFFSPALQLGLVKATPLEKYTNVHLRFGRFCICAEYNISLPTAIQIFHRKSLKKYFKEIDTYCKEMREMADKQHEQMHKICSLLGIAQ